MNILGIMSFKSLKKVFRHLEFVTKGREGAVIYHEGLKQIEFYMGMGGNNVSFYLSIPSKAEWKSATGFSLSSRDEIISYVAEQTRKAQAPYCTYQINETDILFIRH